MAARSVKGASRRASWPGRLRAEGREGSGRGARRRPPRRRLPGWTARPASRGIGVLAADRVEPFRPGLAVEGHATGKGRAAGDHGRRVALRGKEARDLRRGRPPRGARGGRAGRRRPGSAAGRWPGCARRPPTSRAPSADPAHTRSESAAALGAHVVDGWPGSRGAASPPRRPARRPGGARRGPRPGRPPGLPVGDHPVDGARVDEAPELLPFLLHPGEPGPAGAAALEVRARPWSGPGRRGGPRGPARTRSGSRDGSLVRLGLPGPVRAMNLRAFSRKRASFRETVRREMPRTAAISSCSMPSTRTPTATAWVSPSKRESTAWASCRSG